MQYKSLIYRNGLLVYLFPLLLILSCSESSHYDNGISNLVLGDSVFLPLDDQTGHYYPSFQISEFGSKPLFHFFNGNNRQIYIYDLANIKLEQKIKLNKDGPNGVGNLSNLDVSVNNDFLYVLNSDYQRLYRLDRAGILQNYIALDSFSSLLAEKLAYANTNATYPMIPVDDSNIFLQSILFGTKRDIQNYHALWKVQLGNNGKVAAYAPYPAIYNKGNLGNTLHYHASFCLMNDSLIAGAFSHDDTIRIFHQKAGDEVDKIVCRSALFDIHAIEPLSEDPAGAGLEDEQKTLYEFTTPRYSKLFYDRNKDCFIRLAVSQTPNREEVKRNGGDFRKGTGLSVIRLNRSGEKTGEWLLPKDIYQIGCTYLFDSKIYIIPKPRYQLFEDKLTFHIYNLPE